MRRIDATCGDVLSIIAAVERDVAGKKSLRWKNSKTRNVEEFETLIDSDRVILEREVWALPEFAFTSHNIRLQDPAGRQLDYVLGFLRPEVNHRLAKLWRALEESRVPM